ncbi:NAD(P)/FAD-dependent oxidoreductase [Thermanaerovibrio velox]|uniref:NAD(P)/FAD-dependent oxidoreductase n=1 Tax=Thermanaerovibrio velox TaxID=108007 RepID=UPI000593F5C0|nr:NAD(P)/FAD-dependent oxidoreductase [Thermanaerovibrio velox]
MSQCRRYDVVVVGAGIVGASIARELSRYKLRVAVLEKAHDIPSGASRANSSMVHGGFDDKPGTVKASFCAKGNRLYHQLHEELDFQLDPCGSYVCAFNGDEIGHLEMLLEQGRTNGVVGLEIITGDQLREREPNASKGIVAALWCSSAAMVNNFEAVLAFMDNAQANGVELFLGTQVTGLIKDPSGRSVMGVSSSGGDFMAPVVVNAAGVYSDELSRMAGDDSFTITPVRGEYFIFDKSVGNLVRSFFFPCPSKKGKGITVARTVDGNLLIGPNSVPQASKEDTSTTGEGLMEVFEGALKLIPSIPRNMSITTFAGLRANSDSGDFHIGPVESMRGFFNVAGIKSPGLTSAPAIAVRVVEMLKDCYGDILTFEEDPSFVPVRRHIPRFSELPMEERIRLAAGDPRYGQIVCRCETVTEAQVVEAIRRGARTVAAVKIWTRAGAGRCQGGFCGPRVVEILARELGISPEEVTRHGGHSRLLTGPTKAPWLEREGA